MGELITEKKKRPTKKLSSLKYRSFIMGIATLSILFYHLPLKTDNSILLAIKSIGYSGVDLFVFCSGWGCSLSYLKNRSAYEFWGRRAKRILPVWFLLLIAFWTPTFLFVRKELNLPVILTVLGNITGLQSFTEKGNVFCWYISLLMVTYLLTPLLVMFVAKNEMRNSVILAFLMILFTFPFWQTKVLIIIISRLPLFFIAIILQKYWKMIRGRNAIIGMGIAMIIGYIFLFIVFHNYDSGVRWAYGLYWYPFILIAPGLTLSLNWLAGRMDSSSLSIVVKAIGWVGKYSFEVYLIQELVKFFVSWLIQTGQAKESNLMWTILFLMVLVVAPLLKLCGDLLRRVVCE